MPPYGVGVYMELALFAYSCNFIVDGRPRIQALITMASDEMYNVNNNVLSDEPCGKLISNQVVADSPEPYLTSDDRLSR